MEIKKLLSILSGNRLILLLGVIGILLLMFSSSGSKEEPAVSPLAAAEEYRASLEASLDALCEGVVGVGEARVFLTLASTEVAVYERNETESSSSVSTAGGDALLLSYRMPPIAGVTVVCDGGDSADVKRELVSLLGAALSLSSAQIHIAPAK